ncbi:MAG: hypothetical protein ACKERG_04510 [Candidatus Hodgkinia cicadicola]
MATAGFPDLQSSPMMHIVAAEAAALVEADSDSFKALRVGLAKRDLQNLGSTGMGTETALSRCFVVMDRNVLPFDPLPANVASGLRLGPTLVLREGCVKLKWWLMW